MQTPPIAAPGNSPETAPNAPTDAASDAVPIAAPDGGPIAAPDAAPNPPLRILPAFFKAHGHGNDYLVFEEGPGAVLTPDLIRAICDRHRGPGGDGIVVVESARVETAGAEAGVGTGADRGEAGGIARGAAVHGPAGPEARLRMFNPDGSEFERSGNGLRIAGVYLRRRGAGREGWFPVATGGDIVRLRVSGPGTGGVWDASVEMGKVGFPSGPPFVHPAEVDGRGRVTLRLPGPGGGGRAPLRVIPVSVGNPHAVAFAAGWSRAEADHYGPLIAASAAFPRGTNVQFAGAPAGREIAIRIWERGVGRTLASGTSACAVVAAAVKSGRMPCGRAAVRMEGGTMEVELREDWAVTLRGPVEEVCDGVLAGRFGGARGSTDSPDPGMPDLS